MPNIVANVLTGVATLYWGAVGALEAACVTEFGYTEDGVTFEYTPRVNDIEVDEETFAVDRVLQKEEVTITANAAENLLANLRVSMAGASAIAGGSFSLGAGAMVDISLKIVGTTVAGATRTIFCKYANPVGTVGMSYKKGTKTIIPVSFKPYQGATGGTPVVITDL